MPLCQTPLDPETEKILRQNNIEYSHFMMVFTFVIVLAAIVFLYFYWCEHRLWSYVGAKCPGCDNPIVYDKCFNCNKSECFTLSTTDKPVRSILECNHCHFKISEVLPCPICNTAIRVEDLRGGRRSNRAEGTNVVVIEQPAAVENGKRGFDLGTATKAEAAVQNMYTQQTEAIPSANDTAPTNTTTTRSVKYCPRCGTQALITAKFCEGCTKIFAPTDTE